jgi:hypothetical protein
VAVAGLRKNHYTRYSKGSRQTAKLPERVLEVDGYPKRRRSDRESGHVLGLNKDCLSIYIAKKGVSIKITVLLP